MRLVQLKWIAATALAIGMSAPAAYSEPVPAKAANAAPAIEVMTDDGALLVSPKGMTLYTYGPDATTPGKSQCSNVAVTTWRDGQGEFGILPVVRPDAVKSCVQKWPPYLAEAGAQPSGEFAFITRTDGGKQWTWRGRPLYFSIKDQKPGDRHGATFQFGGRGRGWAFAAPAPAMVAGLRVMRLDDSLALATNDVRPLYTPKGRRVIRACSGCDDMFKPVLAPQLAQATGDWSIVDAGAGRRQYAYKGKPLYEPLEGVTRTDIMDAGGWEPVLFRKGSGRPADIQVRTALIGEVYADQAGRTLYTFGCGTPGNSGVACNDPGDPAGYWAALCGTAEQCAKRWILYRAPENARPKGDWTIVDVAYPLYKDPRGLTYPPDVPRVKAWAYRGQPVYTYHLDVKPGDVRGQAVQWLGFSSFRVVQVPGVPDI